jgi:DNA-binding CsgD family transcriptional regulator
MALIAGQMLLILIFSLIFSVTFFCFILFIKTRDKLIGRFLTLQVPLFLYFLIVLSDSLFKDDFRELYQILVPGVSLFFLVFVNLLITFIIYGTAAYLLSQLELEEKEYTLGYRIIIFLTGVFFLFSLFFIIYLTGDDWESALNRALNELFLYGSLFLLLPAVTASIFLKRSRQKEKKRLLAHIMISFYPILPLSIFDLFFLLQSPYKLTYLSYALFSLLIYFYIMSHFIHKYKPGDPISPAVMDNFCHDKGISEREREIIGLILEGKSHRETATQLNISYNTVKTHIRNIYQKAQTASKLQLLAEIRNHPGVNPKE